MKSLILSTLILSKVAIADLQACKDYVSANVYGANNVLSVDSNSFSESNGVCSYTVLVQVDEWEQTHSTTFFQKQTRTWLDNSGK